MELINPERYCKLIQEAFNANFSGWNFSWLEERMIQEEPPWDYRRLITDHMKGAHTLLDLGTGGGEFLASLSPLPEDTHATESYPPNQEIAKNSLTPLGITVHKIIDDAPLPFEDNYFDLVISRHEGFDPAEIKRILKPGGVFITQQVGGLDNLELNQILQSKISFEFIHWGLAAALAGLYEADFDVEVAEKAVLRSTFRDIGAVVYYLKAIPWQIEGFDPETHAEGLCKLHNIIEMQGKFTATAHRFLVIARKRSLNEQ
jgi:SAM-dependent methyltransferase